MPSKVRKPWKSKYICSIPGCEKRVNSRSWCSMHYRRWQKNGSSYVLKGPSNGTVPAWLRHAVATKDRGDCWEWPFGTDLIGYGVIHWNGRKQRATAIALELDTGVPRPPGMDCLHSCDNPPCCNPSHLRWGTPRDNIEDMYLRGRGRLGLRAANAKLSDADVLAIRSDLRTNRAIAASYGVGEAHIGRIKNGTRRSRLGGDDLRQVS